MIDPEEVMRGKVAALSPAAQAVIGASGQYNGAQRERNAGAATFMLAFELGTRWALAYPEEAIRLGRELADLTKTSAQLHGAPPELVAESERSVAKQVEQLHDLMTAK